MEACATSQFWAREIAALGQDVRLIPPAYVKPYVKRQKNDAADAVYGLLTFKVSYLQALALFYNS
jgi:transposase